MLNFLGFRYLTKEEQDKFEEFRKKKFTEIITFDKDKFREQILGKGIYPRHLEYWAQTIEREQRHQTQLSYTLKFIAQAIREVTDK
jgi:gas vesicle protein